MVIREITVLDYLSDARSRDPRAFLRRIPDIKGYWSEYVVFKIVCHYNDFLDYVFSFGGTAYAEKAGSTTATATHAGQDLADAFVPEFTVPLAFLGSDKVEFTLLMEMLGVETHPGQDLAAAFSGATKEEVFKSARINATFDAGT